MGQCKGNTLWRSACFACTQRTLFAADDTSFFHPFPLCLSSEESPLSQVVLLASCSCVQSTSVEACASTCGLLLLHSQTATGLGMRTDLALFRTRQSRSRPQVSETNTVIRHYVPCFDQNLVGLCKATLSHWRIPKLL